MMGTNNADLMKDTLPKPRIVMLEINGASRRYYTFSDKPLDDLCLGDLKPFAMLDAHIALAGIVEAFNHRR